MAEQKTKPTKVTLERFLETLPTERRRDEGRKLDAIFRRATGRKPVMWGPSIVGYGQYGYHSPGGSKGVWPVVGFSPRKAALTLYVLNRSQAPAPDLARLGKHKAKGVCLYINKLEDVDLIVLEKLVRDAWERNINTL
jgi:hypothetical protein